eukprot:TRINITY_DN256_c0_g1_i1.p1 TRINITY_DN256_c0_g1~~TRINITY_DN256_c0_g1_i1.p1  ORF type:complete len:135 (-),score=37.71 TRINITY_DN256_c0_g1_i1:91-495(-)
MSWQSYVDQSLIGGGLSKAALLGTQDGGNTYSLYAISGGFSLAQNEITSLVNAFKDASSAQASGLHLGGDKYFALIRPDQVEDGYYCGKLGTGGCCIAKSDTLIIVGCYNENLQPGAANGVVLGVRDYLKNAGL